MARRLRPHSVVGVATAFLLISLGSAGGWAQDVPLPRFASVRADEANMRTGPDFRYPIDWVLTRRHQPVEIIDEYDIWRRVRDWQGDVGWVHHSMLSSARTVIFTADGVLLRRLPARDADAVAEIGRGAVAELLDCTIDWCEVEMLAADRHYRGWTPIPNLWGVTHTKAVPAE